MSSTAVDLGFVRIHDALAVAGTRLRSMDGRSFPLAVDRWHAMPGPEENAVLDLVLPAALDVGCGPARHVLALLGRGIPAIGIDSAESAVGFARSRGARVLHRSIFDRIPHAGRWGSALLLDGNVGIGGDPTVLLARIRRLLRTGGRALVELEPPGVPTERLAVRAESDLGEPSRWFSWARVNADDAAGLADASGFICEDVWCGGERWFARLDAR